LEQIQGASKSEIKIINKQEVSGGNYWTWEGNSLDINGQGTPGTTLWVELLEANVGAQVTVGKDGKWNTKLPATLTGYNKYQVTSRPIIDGKLEGARTNIGNITIVPWFWIITVGVGAIGLVFYIINRKQIKKLKTQISKK
jgi:hypothetical protein